MNKSLLNEAIDDTVVAGAGVAPLARLPDAQVFARDPEDYTQENIDDTIQRLTKILARQRKARQDDAEVKDTAAKLKKTNTVARKKKAGKLAADPMETKV